MSSVHQAVAAFTSVGGGGGGSPATLVQATALQSVVASTSATNLFPSIFANNVTAGNTVVMCITTHQQGHFAPTAIAVGADAMTKDTTIQMNGSVNSNYWLSIWRKTNCTGGTKNITVTWDASNLNDSYCTFTAEEWSGWLSSPVDQTPTPVEGINVTGGSITSGVTSQAAEVVYAAANVRESEATGLAGPSGYTQTGLDTSGLILPIASGYKIVAATAAQTASFTHPFVVGLDMVMVTYKTN